MLNVNIIFSVMYINILNLQCICTTGLFLMAIPDSCCHHILFIWKYSCVLFSYYSCCISERSIKMCIHYTDNLLSELDCLSVKLKCVFNSIISPEVYWHESITVYLIPDVQQSNMTKHC